MFYADTINMNDKHSSCSDFIDRNLGIFCCPKCGGDLVLREKDLNCPKCGGLYQILDGIPLLFCQNEPNASKEDVTDKIKAFYEKTPFPDYDEFDNAGSLMEKARKSFFAKSMDDQIPYGVRVLECGCGTGQLTNFLSIANRTVIGTDICLNSLKLGHEFKESNDLERAHFFQMNLFRPCFKPQSFDLVISNGVLHHTGDPFGAFKSISDLVKPGGYILIGLYHKYGRLATDLRRIVFNLTRNRFKFLDQRTTNKSSSRAKRDAWFMDQYKNPHESKHTVGEVLHWLEATKFEFIHGIPKTTLFESYDKSEILFKPDRLGSRFERFFVNMGMIFTGHKEGGFFIIIAKRTNI